MKEFNEWLFELKVPLNRDAHNTIASFLRNIGYSHLFKSSEPQKAITYVVYRHAVDGDRIIAKSSEPIEHESVQPHSFHIDVEQPVKVVVQVSSKRKIRPPKILHEPTISKRTKTIIREMTEVEKFEKASQVLAELGFKPDQTVFDVLGGIPIEIHHKRDNLKIMEPTMNIVIHGVITDIDKFIVGYKTGIGNKRAYGLGCVRIFPN
ncbi:hypothetical protein HLH17_14540 [Acinetobacter sp. ANC 5380]|uniref:Type I-E CRISPR-associated protein Cas6/Cse3/CasE n=1 Tax=Acinetobacter terrae TaxID=2731247 RepID=A0A7Y2RHF8_9GAMM|nr:hypothetical protein [Acinetobacter terrae]NNH78840.1 hypothetical protein [Acinetobacter terrae]